VSEMNGTRISLRPLSFSVCAPTARSGSDAPSNVHAAGPRWSKDQSAEVEYAIPGIRLAEVEWGVFGTRTRALPSRPA